MALGLPQVLLLLAMVVGVLRVSRPSAATGITTRQALFVWPLLLAGGVSVWVSTVARRL